MEEKYRTPFVWDYFHIVMSVRSGFAYDMGKTWKKPHEFAICNCCGKKLQCKHKNGWDTGSLDNHLNGHKDIVKKSGTGIKRLKNQLTVKEAFTKRPKCIGKEEKRRHFVTTTTLWVATKNSRLVLARVTHLKQ